MYKQGFSKPCLKFPFWTWLLYLNILFFEKQDQNYKLFL